jgi:transcriptional regulator with XRE-family HTH domain
MVGGGIMPRKAAIQSEQDKKFAETLGTILSERRKELRMSLANVCRQMPQGYSCKRQKINRTFSTSTLCRVERGKLMIKITDFYHLCKILNLSPVNIIETLRELT